MNKRDDGGPAFPEPSIVLSNGELYPGREGMTLRDHFAAAVLPSLIGLKHYDFRDLYGEPAPGVDGLDFYCDVAYRYADSMIRARGE